MFRGPSWGGLRSATRRVQGRETRGGRAARDNFNEVKRLLFDRRVASLASPPPSGPRSREAAGSASGARDAKMAGGARGALFLKLSLLFGSASSGTKTKQQKTFATQTHPELFLPGLRRDTMDTAQRTLQNVLPINISFKKDPLQTAHQHHLCLLPPPHPRVAPIQNCPNSSDVATGGQAGRGAVWGWGSSSL